MSQQFDLGADLEHRYEVAHRKQEGYQTPCVVLREATYGEAYGWRKKEGTREARRRVLHLKRLKHLGWSEDEYTELAQQNSAMLHASSQHFVALAKLMPPAPTKGEDGEDVPAVVEDEETRLAREASAVQLAADYERDVVEPWAPIADKIQLYQDLIGADDFEDFDQVRHTLDLVLRCVTRLEGVMADGVPLVWAECDGARKQSLMERLLGPAASGIDALTSMARLVTQGLTDHQKKA